MKRRSKSGPCDGWKTPLRFDRSPSSSLAFEGTMMNAAWKSAKTPGIKIRVAKDRLVQLVDRETGKWLANVRWRPSGTMYVGLAESVKKTVVHEGCP